MGEESKILMCVFLFCFLINEALASRINYSASSVYDKHDTVSPPTSFSKC